uniref:Uncharacterized protein n=1 Tax=Anguilla anguilla TaxID=7936 RepID=A0A0E9V838_ANGAN
MLHSFCLSTDVFSIQVFTNQCQPMF